MKDIKRLTQSQLAGFLSFLILWELLHLLLKTRTIPSPVETVDYILTVPGQLLRHCAASILRVAAAVVVSMLLGVPAGIVLGVNKTCKRLFSPLLYFIYPVPKVAFLPVFMLLFGLGNTSKIILVIFIIIFQIILSVRDGVEHIPPLYFKVMESFCAPAGRKYRYLILPAILPHIFGGLRISIGISLASLFFAENYATVYGIGYYILSAWTKMDYVQMFSGILALGLVGIVLFKLLDRLEAACVPWLKRMK
ncbi:ABC transporter permease [Ruminiclostridium cellobioparum]|uniref:ABC transporter permease n=1 Tax=Ruminiclostridium cellobioparum TaxID=29355 RepID=UPI0004871F0E|nr:ABC transporter permease [Ruminiclostridium cellobioparum]